MLVKETKLFLLNVWFVGTLLDRDGKIIKKQATFVGINFGRYGGPKLDTPVATPASRNHLMVMMKILLSTKWWTALLDLTDELERISMHIYQTVADYALQPALSIAKIPNEKIFFHCGLSCILIGN